MANLYKYLPCVECGAEVAVAIPGPIGGPYALAKLHRLGPQPGCPCGRCEDRRARGIAPPECLCRPCVVRLGLEIHPIRGPEAETVFYRGQKLEMFCNVFLRSVDPALAGG